ncbi:TniQ family protein [Streptomyces sp. CC208A]|uniref:TniQ family protein n=1 Tax=Streptomyces sp. CC208A TaxID=3044573 RepID=UPI0024A9363F|nr:TniQ family protein [Streptomyces sp. CC208A]
MPKAPRKKRTRTRTSWRPARALPRQVRFIAGESTGSFARRLAAENGLQPEEFWPLVGDGNQIFDPRYSEAYLNAAALDRLAGLTGRDTATLQWPLPNLRPHRLLDTGPGPVWRWPWDATSGYLVRACELCAHTKGTAENAYLISPTTWQVCTRHHRWLDNRREEHAASIPLHTLPDIIHAHQRQLTLQRRLGESGRVLFADAYAIAAYWWNLPALSPPAWRKRQNHIGPAGADDVRCAPLVLYPEAVHLAEAMAARERRRLRGPLTPTQAGLWLHHVAGFLEDWRMPADLAIQPVLLWAARHQDPDPAPRQTSPRPARGRYRRLPLPHPHTTQPIDTTLPELSCLPWQIGELLRSSLSPAPGGWTLTGRA